MVRLTERTTLSKFKKGVLNYNPDDSRSLSKVDHFGVKKKNKMDPAQNCILIWLWEVGNVELLMDQLTKITWEVIQGNFHFPAAEKMTFRRKFLIYSELKKFF